MDEVRFNELWNFTYCCGFDAARDELIPNLSHPMNILFEEAYLAGYEDGLESVR